MAVRAREADEQLQVDLLRQPAKGAVGHGVFRLVKRARTEVFGNQAEHLPAHVESIQRVDVESIEDPCRRLNAHRLVVRRLDAAVDQCRRGRFAEIVADGAEHDRGQARPIEIAIQLARLVNHQQRVNPDVAFRMPFGILRTVVERLHLRKQLVDDAELAREREADRRALGLEQQFFAFAPDALGRQIVESDRRTDPRRVGIDRQLESRRELQGTEDTEGVVREGLRIHHSEDTEVEVLAALKGIEIFVGERIPANRVDREIATPRGIFK